MLSAERKSHLREKRGIPWSLNDRLGEFTVTAVSPNVYLPPKIYENLISDQPDPVYVAILAHEFTHVERQQDFGVLKWLALYLLSAEFRVNEELIADAEQMKYLAAAELPYDVEARAKMLSSGLYFWPITYDAALARLTQQWAELS